MWAVPIVSILILAGLIVAGYFLWPAISSWAGSGKKHYENTRRQADEAFRRASSHEDDDEGDDCGQ